MRGQNDLRLSGSRKNAVTFKRPNGLFKSALMDQAVKDGRKDDEPATILERLKIYHELTEPLVDFYRERGKLVVVEGQEEVADTTRLLLEKLGVSL